MTARNPRLAARAIVAAVSLLLSAVAVAAGAAQSFFRLRQD